MIPHSPPPEPSTWAAAVRSDRAHVSNQVRLGRVLHDADFNKSWKDFKAVLAACQADGKCAFCETQPTKAAADVEHFRPKGEVFECSSADHQRAGSIVSSEKLRSSRVFSGYWWLAYEWSNLRLACDECNREWKRCFFPVSAPRRRAPSRHGVARERVMLLDPFVDRRLDSHFSFDINGQIHGVSKRARWTIATCGLHRDSLSDRRRRHIMLLKHPLDTLVACLKAADDPGARAAYPAVAAFLDRKQPYVGAARSLITRVTKMSLRELHRNYGR